MPEAEDLMEVTAPHGEKMVEVKVRFWTNNIAENEGCVIPKHVWGSGVVRLAGNDVHGIDASQPLPFNSLMELPAKIEELLIENEITVRPSRKERKYREG